MNVAVHPLVLYALGTAGVSLLHVSTMTASQVSDVVAAVDIETVRARIVAGVFEREKAAKSSLSPHVAVEELVTYPLKLAEAKAYTATGEEPVLLRLESQIAGLSLDALVSKVLAKSRVFQEIEARLSGLSSLLRRRAGEARTLDELCSVWDDMAHLNVVAT